MEIKCINKDSLYSIKYESEEKHEFGRLFELWTESIYLENFFETHKSDLDDDFWRGISINEAIYKTTYEASELEYQLYEISEEGKNNRYETLSTFFKPLHDSTTRIDDFEKNKAKVEIRRKPSWLRIYAIRIKPNLFVITGGAIKLTKTMNTREHLRQELRKLDDVREFIMNPDNSDLIPFDIEY